MKQLTASLCAFKNNASQRIHLPKSTQRQIIPWLSLLVLGASLAHLRAEGPGSALSFDGTNGVVLLQNPIAPFPSLSNSFTIEFWAKPAALRDASAPESNSGTAGTFGQRYAIFPDNGDTVYAAGHAGVGISVGINGIAVFARGNGYLPPLLSYNVSTTNWSHVAVVIETNRPRLYVNGVLVRTGVASSRILHPSLTLGDPGANYGHYAGLLDEVRVWTGLRSATQIQNFMNSPLAGNEAGLTTYYRLNEAAGDLVTDGTTGGLNGQRFASGGGFPAWIESTAPVGTPIIQVTAASQLRSTSAQLNGSVQPHGINTAVWFEWGLSTNYGFVTPTISVSNGFSVLAVSQTISNLNVATAYHYRFVSSNSLGLAYSTNATFTTPYFNPVGVGLPQVGFGFSTWGDFDGNGKLDILLDGNTINALDYVDVWGNTGSGFVQRSYNLTWVQSGAVDLADINNDGRLDIGFTGDDIAQNAVLQLATNNGSGFTLQSGAPTAIQRGNLSWGDYDNDGLQDALLVGFRKPASYVGEIWRNTGHGFTNLNAGLTGGTLAAAAWGDYDNDGYLDLLETGANGPNFAQVWRNTGRGFTNLNAGITGVSSGSVAWGDYDNDGRLDIVIAGWLDAFTARVAQVWRNTGNGFTNIAAGLPGFTDGSAAWGDFDNDGRLDLLLAGQSGSPSARQTQIWRNTTNGFVLVASGLPGIANGGASWGDYDNDGRLDILLAGYTGSVLVSDVWRSDVPVTNTLPTMPQNLTASPTSTGIALNWGMASDAQTPASGLSYNLRVGTSPGTANIVSPQADLITGFRYVAKLGNAQMRTNSLLRLPPGRYYWSVQAIDTARAGGPWAAEQIFDVGAPRFIDATMKPAQGIQLSVLGYTGLTYTVIASTNLGAPTNQWTTVTNFTIGTNGVFDFLDPAATNLPTRFYRARKP